MNNISENILSEGFTYVSEIMLAATIATERYSRRDAGVALRVF